MTDDETLTLLDAWPLLALLALAIFAIVVVVRGLGRKADDSHNRSNGGGSSFQGKGGRW